MTALFTALFDDAAIFPPGNSPLPEAVAAHRGWQRTAAAPMVGPFVVTAAHLDELAGLGAGFPLAVTVPSGPPGLADVLATDGFDVVSVETPYAAGGLAELQAAAATVTVYAEVPVMDLTDELAAQLVAAGLRLKLRTGGTHPGSFPSGPALATALVVAVHAGLPFKLTAGLHNALRHRDPVTGLEHHGFGNVLAAVAEARRGDSNGTGRAEIVDSVTAILEAQEPQTIIELVNALNREDIVAVRERFTSFGTCSIIEPLDDLVALGLLPASFRLASGNYGVRA